MDLLEPSSVMYKFFAVISPSRCGATYVSQLLTDLRIGKPEEYFSSGNKLTPKQIVQTKVNLLGVRATTNREELSKLRQFIVEDVGIEPFLIHVCRRDWISHIISTYFFNETRNRYCLQTKDGKPAQKYQEAYRKITNVDEKKLDQTISQILEERDLLDKSSYLIPNCGHLKVYYEDLIEMPTGVLNRVANTIYMTSADSIIKALEKPRYLKCRDFYPKKLVEELESLVEKKLKKVSER